MDIVVVLAIIAIVVVLIFDYTNGFHDASNIVASVVASKAMTPTQAVAVVAVFEFLGPLLGGTAVANTIGKFVTLDDLPRLQALEVVMAGLLGAITWNLVTWWRGIPSSSSHALVGALAGAVTAAVGADHVAWGFDELHNGHLAGVTKVIAALILSPIIGFWVGFVLHRIMLALVRTTTNDHLRRAQWITAAGLGFSHGANDAQKSMGIMALILMLGGFTTSFVVPLWVMVACAAAMTLGILSGGWRIVRTLGYSIYRIRPLHALDSQLTSGAVIFGASIMGAPVSTTHVVATSIMGIGTSENHRAVRWAKAREIVTTWAITIPGSALAAVLFHLLLRAILPE